MAFNLGRVPEAGVEEIRVLIPSRAAVGEIVLSLTSSPAHNRVEVIGTEGRMTADWGSLHVVSTRRSPLPGTVTRITSNWGLGAQLARGSLRLAVGALTGRMRSYMGLRALIGEYYRTLRAGEPSPVSPDDGVLNVQLMEKVRAACGDVVKARDEVVQPVPTTPRDGALALVTGGTGFVGRRVVERLAADDLPVRATTRLASRAGGRDDVEWVPCNISNEDELRRALVGVDTVYHCAAMADAPGTLEDFEEANVHGTMRLTRLAAEAGVRTLVYLSSISVYAKPTRGSRYLDERAAYDARAGERGAYTQSKLAADRALLEYAREHSQPRIVLLRPGTIYGPGAKLPVGRFALPSPSADRPLVAGGANVPVPLVHVDNVIDAMLLASANDALPSGSVYNVVDAADCTQGEVARTLHTVTGGRLRPIHLPYPLVWSLMLAVDILARLRRGTMGTARYRLARTLADMRYRSDAARQELGWAPRVTLDAGLAQVLEAARDDPFPH